MKFKPHHTMSTVAPIVRQTIAAIAAMGLECTRTNAGTGEYRIMLRTDRGCHVAYAWTAESALAIAKRLAPKPPD